LLLATTAGTGLAIAGILPINLGLPVANSSTSSPPQIPTATFTATATITPTPVPPALVTVHTASVPVPTTLAALQDQVIGVTASCGGGEQLLGGGYALDGPMNDFVLAIQGSFPSDAQGNPTTAGPVGQAWTAEVAGPPIPQPPRITRSLPFADG